MSTWKFRHHEWPAGLGYSSAPYGPSLVDDRHLYQNHRIPENEYQALMEADFGEEPALSVDEREAQWAVIQERIAAANLTEEEMAVVDLVVFGQMSLSEAGFYMARWAGINKAYPKQRVHRIRNKAFAKLRETLGDLIQIETEEMDDDQELD